jgi:MarR family transcriptional regulator, lower aerobic nicotinate degradation pathway regulator
MQDVMSSTRPSRKPRAKPLSDPKKPTVLPPLAQRPGYLIRRLHQIHTALFAEECGDENITPIMYSVISALGQIGPVDQTNLAHTGAIDKTNMANLLERLRRRGLIQRSILDTDRRVRIATLTDEGRALLHRLDAKVESAHHRTVEHLGTKDQKLFVAMMKQIVDAAEHG